MSTTPTSSETSATPRAGGRATVVKAALAPAVTALQTAVGLRELEIRALSIDKANLVERSARAFQGGRSGEPAEADA